MKFKCPHCYSSTFRLLTGAGGATVAQCLHCGEASPFSLSRILDSSGRARLSETVPAQYPARGLRPRRRDGRKHPHA